MGYDTCDQPHIAFVLNLAYLKQDKRLIASSQSSQSAASLSGLRAGCAPRVNMTCVTYLW